MNSSQTPTDHVLERRKIKWFLGFIVIFLLLTGGTDVIMSFFGTPNIPKEHNPFVLTEASPTPFFLPSPTSSLIPIPSPSISKAPSVSPIQQIPSKAAVPFCTQDAKLCPDGKTYVGRSGPNCEFVACPK